MDNFDENSYPEIQGNKTVEENNTSAPTAYRNEPVRYKRPSGLLFLATALIGAVIGGLIVAAIVPSYLYDRMLSVQQEGTAPSGQQLVI